MRRILPISLLLLIAFTFQAQLPAQNADQAHDSAKVAEPTPHFYHMEFLVQELDSHPESR